MRKSVQGFVGALAVSLTFACGDSTAPNQQPVASISAPGPGFESFVGDPVTFQGSATDPESGALTGSALTWQSSIDGTLGTGSSVTVSTLLAGSHSITLVATDPTGGTGSAQVAIDIVENQPPAVTISSPADAAQFLAGEEIQFTGSANDPEDGAIPETSLAWSSDLDGALGTGAQLTTLALSVGEHVITLTATDGRELAGSSSTGVIVLQNGTPAVTISEPIGGTEFLQGVEIGFTGSATDPEDGSLTATSLLWNSSIDGTIGTGTSFTTTALSLGDHVVTLTATDAQGQVGSATVSIRITTPAGLAPDAAFTFNCSGLTCDFFDASTDADGTLETWNWDFGDGEVSSDPSPQHLYTTGGPYTVSLVVSDDAGNNSDPAIESFSLSTPVQAGFQIEVRVSPGSSLTPSQQSAIDNAVARWEELVTGDLLETQVQLPANACGIPTPALDELVDDLVIYVSFVPIDGSGGILGSAGPCWIRNNDYLPVLGVMQFDTADLATMESNGMLADVLLHEMGHVLGFGTLWSRDLGGGTVIFDFLNNRTDPASPTAPDSVPSNDTHFDGAFAVAAFDDVSSPDYTAGAKVPVENDNQTPDPVAGAGSLNGHWRDAIFTNELMTAWIAGSGNPLSLVTVESLRDMGYQVNAAAADPFGISFNLVSDQPSSAHELRDDIRRGPITVVDQSGRTVDIVEQKP
jgi:PKD repeat protein